MILFFCSVSLNILMPCIACMHTVQAESLLIENSDECLTAKPRGAANLLNSSKAQIATYGLCNILLLLSDFRTRS